MKSSKQTEEGNTDILVPIELVENILLRLPVKSLVRFQSVCKLWHSTISDPRFCRSHYGTTRNNNLLFVERWTFNSTSIKSALPPHLVKLENGKLGTECKLDSPFDDESNLAVSACNGIVLMVPRNPMPWGMVLGLWNPAIRKHYKGIQAPHLSRKPPQSFGLYYDSRIDDYKIAIIYDKCYVVYSCQRSSWEQPKSLPYTRDRRVVNVTRSSSFYWLHSKDIVCLDVRDEKLSKIPLPIVERLGPNIEFVVSCLSERLCLLYVDHHADLAVVCRMFVLEKHNNSWMELMNSKKDHFPKSWWPLLLTNEDNVVLRSGGEVNMYDHLRKRLMKLESDIRLLTNMLSYSESLCFPIQNSVPRRKLETSAE